MTIGEAKGTTTVLFHDAITAQRAVWATEKLARLQCGLFSSPKGWGKERGVQKRREPESEDEGGVDE